jgi:hypothetical protein
LPEASPPDELESEDEPQALTPNAASAARAITAIHLVYRFDIGGISLSIEVVDERVGVARKALR